MAHAAAASPQVHAEGHEQRDDHRANQDEVARVLRAGGRFGISELFAAGEADPDRLADAAVGIGAGERPLSAIAFRRALQAAGLTDARVETTHAAGGGIRSLGTLSRSPQRRSWAWSTPSSLGIGR